MLKSMGSNYMIIAPNVSVEPVLSSISPATEGFVVTVNGEQWVSSLSAGVEETSSIFDTANDARRAFLRENPDTPNLNEMARDKVGDGKKPELYFVTVEGQTLIACDDLGRAIAFAQSREVQNDRGELAAWIENRSEGLVWENDACASEQAEDE